MGSASAWTPVADTSAWTPVHEAAPPSATSRFGSGIYSTTLAPIVHLFTTNPVDSVVSMFKGAIGADDLKAIKAAAQHGDYKSAAVLTGHYLTQNPATRAASAMGQDVEKSIKEGDYAGAAGKVLGDAITVGAPIAGEAAAGSRAGIALKAGASAAARDVATGAAKIGVGTVLPKIPGVSYGLEYMGGKQVLSGLSKGVKAARESFNPTAAEGAAPVIEEVGGVSMKDLDAFAQKNGFKNYEEVPKDYKPSFVNLARTDLAHPRTATVARTVTPAEELAAAQSPQGLEVPIEQPAAPYRPEVTHVGGRPVRPPLRSPAVPSPAVESAAGVSPEVAAPSAEPKTELEDLLERSLNGEKVAEQAKAELNDHLKLEALKKTESIIDKHQTARALKLGKFLQDYGIQPEHIDRMTPEEWQQVGSVAEVENPSATTIQKTKDLLKMGQDQ